MRIFNSVSAFLAISGYARAEESEDSDVVVLTNDSFDDFVSENKYVLAEFYAPWCGHCKNLAPHYEKAATELKEAGSEAKLAKIDATVEQDLAKKFGVQGYPTLLWFVNGQKSDYKGGRTSETIVEWINKKTGPAVRTGDLPEPSGQPLIVLRASSITDDFTKAAEVMGDDASFHFVETDGEASITVQHKGEEAVVASSDDMSSSATIVEFVRKNLLPLFGNLDGETYGRYMASGRGMVWVLLSIESSEELAGAVDAIRSDYIALAKKFPQYCFTYIDTVVFKAAVENMLGVSSFPAVAVHKKAGDRKKYILADEVGTKEVATFLKNVEAGKVEPTLKSEEVPETNDEPVKVVVGSTLQEQVFQPEKDVLLEVYAPWCGHCKKLAPEYEKLALKVRKEGLEDILSIAKMDGTTNDSPVDSISWEGFPTLFYVKAGSSVPVPFEAGRDAKSIWKWIKKNHSKSDEIAKRLAEAKAAAAGGEEAEGKDEL